ncbi:MAG: tetratricopeptide repeat protein [Alistipes sp.]|nr:tetratricopeptide repeat protein [Alistipes sp.]
MTKQNEQEALGAAMSKTEEFFERNSKRVSVALLAIFVLAAAIFGYRQLISQPRNKKAAEMIAEAQYRFEAATPDYRLALEGDANGAGFLEVIDRYGATKTGNLAKHYAGICYLRLGEMDNAADYLARFKPMKGIPAQIINAQNLGLQGDVAVERADYPAAIRFFEKAVASSDNDLTAPMYLRKAALAAKAAGNTEQAIAFAQRILDEYPASVEARNAEKLIGSFMN